jgi:DNA-binding transcriptional regulator YhcF (GntR family)
VIIRIQADSPTPPYAQVHDQIATMVRAGVLAPDTRLPAIRQLANDLGVAPNTIARAYRELEQDGLVATRGRNGTTVLAPPAQPVTAGGDEVDEAAAQYALEVRHRGMDLDAALDAVRRAFGSLDDRRRFS